MFELDCPPQLSFGELELRALGALDIQDIFWVSFLLCEMETSPSLPLFWLCAKGNTSMDILATKITFPAALPGSESRNSDPMLQMSFGLCVCKWS